MCLLVECLCHILQKAQRVGSHVPASPLLNELSMSPTSPLTQSALPDIIENKYLTEGFVAKTNENFIVHITLSCIHSSNVNCTRTSLLPSYSFQLQCLLGSLFPSHSSPWALISLILLLDPPSGLSVSLFPYEEYFNSATNNHIHHQYMLQ